MCISRVGYQPPKQKKYEITITAPCGKVLFFHAPHEMRNLNFIDNDKLIKRLKQFAKELGFSGDDWMVKVTETVLISSMSSDNSTTTVKVFK